LRASALLYQARLSRLGHDVDAPAGGTRNPPGYREDLQRSLELYRSCDDASGIAACLGALVFAEAWAGHHEQAEALGDEAVRFARRANDAHVLAQALGARAVAPASYEKAASQARTAVAHLHAVGDLSRIARLCTNIAYLAIVDPHYRDATAWLNDARKAAGELGITSSDVYIRGCEGLAKLFLDDLDDAAQGFADALRSWREMRPEELVGELLIAVSAVITKRGEFARGAQLAGAAGAHMTPGRSWNEKTIRTRLHDEILSPARERYGAERWDHAEREGASLSVDEAIHLALTGARSSPSASGPRTAARHPVTRQATALDCDRGTR
jgi:hypothetical protein